MIHASVATTLDDSQVKPHLLEASVLNAQAYFEVAQWTYIALMKLHNLEHGKGAGIIKTPVAPEAAMYARTVLTDLTSGDLPVPGVCSVEGGSVALIWTVGMKQVEAIVGPDKSGTFVVSDGDRIIVDGDIIARDTSALSKALEDMIAA